MSFVSATSEGLVGRFRKDFHALFKGYQIVPRSSIKIARHNPITMPMTFKPSPGPTYAAAGDDVRIAIAIRRTNFFMWVIPFHSGELTYPI